MTTQFSWSTGNIRKKQGSDARNRRRRDPIRCGVLFLTVPETLTYLVKDYNFGSSWNIMFTDQVFYSSVQHEPSFTLQYNHFDRAKSRGFELFLPSGLKQNGKAVMMARNFRKQSPLALSPAKYRFSHLSNSVRFSFLYYAFHSSFLLQTAAFVVYQSVSGCRLMHRDF